VPTKFLKHGVIAAGAALAMSAMPTAASAATVLFNLTSLGSATTGGIKFMTSTVGGVNVRMSAWSLAGTGSTINPTSTISKSSIQSYSGTGLGAISTGDSSSCCTHAIDNQTSRDFILFQFDQSVKLNTGYFSPFAVGSGTDTDFTVGRGTTATPWTTQLNLTGTTAAGLSTLLSGGLNHYNGPGTASFQSLNPSGGYGNVWIIGAKFTNTGTIDSFKFSKLTVTTGLPVPESSTWMMMIVGFGAVGATMRRKKAISGTVIA
jgi:hypothetical protein